ncbi:hypothetical protein DOT_0127 [Desulfosporosinus sp. OT]|nr:hypothetical protein DOT_0127 [Desulfosporosinus sp. OT]
MKLVVIQNPSIFNIGINIEVDNRQIENSNKRLPFYVASNC